MRTPMRLLAATLVLTAALTPGHFGLSQELSRSAMLSASCEGCHGRNGHSPGAIPSIGGKSAEYLREMMESFRSGEKSSTVMGRHVKGYSEEEIRLISEYFASQ